MPDLLAVSFGDSLPFFVPLKREKVDFITVNRLTRLQRRTIDSIDRLDRFRGLGL